MIVLNNLLVFLMLFSQIPSTMRTQAIEDQKFSSAEVTLHIRREDEIHAQVSGNKYRKLKYNLLTAKEQGVRTILTFGGAYSNHIAATAFAAKEMGFECIGVIRGEELIEKWQHNSTLMRAHEQGMQLHFISRADYRNKHKPVFIEKLHQQFGQFYQIPEGGTNALAVKGCIEILTKDDLQNYDVICCAVGTGGTVAGLINAVQDKQIRVIGFPALNAPSLQQEIGQYTQPDLTNWILNFDYTFGGYAKTTDELMVFIDAFKTKHGIQLEPIYTGKMLYGIHNLVEQGYFAKGARILAIHTGGLQGFSDSNF